MFNANRLSRAIALPFAVMLLTTAVHAADSTTGGTSTGTTTGTTTTTTTTSTDSDHKSDGLDHSMSRVVNGASAIKGNLKTSQHIYYPGDPLNISVQFPRGADLLATKKLNAYVVIYATDGTATKVQVPSDVGSNPRQFFKLDSVDTKTLKEGQYQLGLVATIPAGDPLKLTDWYSGFRGLLDTQAIMVSSTPVAGDKDRDGEWDHDSSRHGIDDDDQ